MYVLLGGGTSPADQRPNASVPSDQSELVEVMRDQIGDLRAQLERANERDRENRRIIAALTSRIPAIEAPASRPGSEPSEPPGGPTDATEQPGRVEPQQAVRGAQEGAQHRSWWRRMFGG